LGEKGGGGDSCGKLTNTMALSHWGNNGVTLGQTPPNGQKKKGARGKRAMGGRRKGKTCPQASKNKLNGNGGDGLVGKPVGSEITA